MSDTTTNPTAPNLPPPAAAPAPAAPPVAYPPAYTRSGKNPVIAGLLSVIPGVGHLYLGLFGRAALFFVGYLVVISAIKDSHGFAGFATYMFFWTFAIFDAVKQANALCCSPAVVSPAADSEFGAKGVGGSLGFGVFLILVGLWFLLRKFVSIDLEPLIEWSPLLLVLFGGWQVFSYFKAKETKDKPKEEPLV